MQSKPDLELIDADDRRYRAMIDADLAALASSLAQECRYLHSSAKVHTKDQYLDYVKSGSIRYLSAAREEAAVWGYGEVAVMTGRVRIQASVAEKMRALHVRFQSVWVWRDGRWQMSAWASVTVPDGG